MYALIDGNCFYASCQRIFRPDLAHKAIVVLSNNDGCVVTRTREAKALGIKMAVPFFQIAHLERAGLLTVFSSNYELYADVSARMMASIASLVPQVEVYSIDECFADLAGMHDELTTLGQQIRARVAQWVGIPTCVGIAPTKTLAKFCNHLAKRHDRLGGVLNWCDLSPERQGKALASEPVGEVWGIGRQTTDKLGRMGILTALDLAQADPSMIRARLGVVVERTQRELQGIACLKLEDVAPAKQQLVRSRSFGGLIQDQAELAAAIAHHVAEAAADLRAQGSVAALLGVELHTHRFHEQAPQHHVLEWTALPVPCNDTLALTREAQRLLERLYRPGFGYKKAGVLLSGIEKGPARQLDLLAEAVSPTREALLATLDTINTRYGRGTLRLAAEGLGQQWHMRRDRVSPCYTTRFCDLPRVG